MNKIIYKTQPLLLILSMSFLGFVFFGLLFLVTLHGIQNDNALFVLPLVTIFAIFSLVSLFCFLNIKTIKLTNENVIISYLFLPINKTLNLKEIRNMEQTEKEIEALYGASPFTVITTQINLADSKSIKLNSIGRFDFEEFYKTFNKLRRGEGKIREQKRHLLPYFSDNIVGLLWTVFGLIVTAGLGYGIFTNQ